MKLVDFTNHSALNELRSRMNAPLINWDVSGWVDINSEELRRKLNSIEGIEVDVEEIALSSDGTFEYKGHKVLVYIRDQYFNPKYADREYKFHIASCDTIRKAFANGRADRYVVSTRTDGRFLVNVRNFYSQEVVKENAIEELHVCKNCLLRLSYNGYRSHPTGLHIYSTFSLGDFFQKYGGSQFTKMPRYSDLNAPPDEYAHDFNKLSLALRQKNEWRCDRCNRDFSSYRVFLHTHHKNGIKGDNRPDNLQTLCLGCHSLVPGHERLRFTPDYKHFKKIFG